MEHLLDAGLGGGHAARVHAGNHADDVLGQVRLLLFDDLAAAHHVHGGLAGHEAEHVEVDVLVIFDFDDVLGAVTLGVGVHDERKLGFGRVDFQVFENLQRGSGRHMVDNDAVLNAGLSSTPYYIYIYITMKYKSSKI